MLLLSGCTYSRDIYVKGPSGAVGVSSVDVTVVREIAGQVARQSGMRMWSDAENRARQEWLAALGSKSESVIVSYESPRKPLGVFLKVFLTTRGVIDIIGDDRSLNRMAGVLKARFGPQRVIDHKYIYINPV